MTDPTVRATQGELRLMVLALVVLALGSVLVCSLRPEPAVRVLNPNQADPLPATEGSLSPASSKIGGPVELLAVAELHHAHRGPGSYCASAGVLISEPGESRFLRVRRFSWDRRYLVSGWPTPGARDLSRGLSA